MASAHLEALAYRMQTARQFHEREVLIERDRLIDQLVAIVGERSGAATPEATRRVVERWVRFLEAGTGLLVEQRPGVFAFFHLSLMEYLAAKGMEKAGDLERTIVSRFGDSAWREVCLLAVGSRATDDAFLDRLYKFFTSKKLEGAWSFLLHCLREEAAFSDEQRVAIVRGVAGDLLDKWSWVQDQQVLDDIRRLSMRHAEWARSWISQELASATGEALQAIVLIRLPHEEETLAVLRERHDASEIAGSLLDFWPKARIGRWAAEVIAPATASPAAVSGPELIIPRSLAGLNRATGKRWLAPFLLELTRSAAEVVLLARRQEQRLAKHRRPGGKGLPPTVHIEPGPLGLGVSTLWPARLPDAQTRYFTKYFATLLARCFCIPLIPIFIGYFISSSFRDIASALQKSFATDSIRDFAHRLYSHTSRLIDMNRPGYLIGKFTLDDSPESAHRWAELFDATPVESLPAMAAPINGSMSADVAALRDIPKNHVETAADAETKRLMRSAWTRLVGEGWVGLMTTIEASDDERRAYCHRRVLNAWLLQDWPVVDDLLPDPPTAEALALYLALGWTQATTTRQWPATQRWIGLLSGAAPAEWLPRSQWHLCWLLHDPEDGGHRRDLAEALDEGLKDESRPGLAAELRSLFGGSSTSPSPGSKV